MLSKGFLKAHVLAIDLSDDIRVLALRDLDVNLVLLLQSQR